MTSADYQDIKRKLSELELRSRKRRRRGTVLMFAPLLCVAAILGTLLILVRDKQRKLTEKQEAVTELENKRKQLDGEIEKRREAIANQEKQIADLAAEQQEMADYSSKLRSILEGKGQRSTAESTMLKEEGKIPGALKTALRPKAKVTCQPHPYRRYSQLCDVDLWLEIPPGDIHTIESITYDLDAVHYKNNRFMTEPGAPDKPVSFSVYGCGSKVLITVKLKDPGGSLTMDFDWCQTPGWPSGKSLDAPLPPPEDAIQQGISPRDSGAMGAPVPATGKPPAAASTTDRGRKLSLPRLPYQFSVPDKVLPDKPKAPVPPR